MNWWKLVLGVEVTILVVLSQVFLALPDDQLHIVACDVGQGDAFLILYKTTQVLIDAGPGQQVLECLGNNMPFWDKKIELAILTHPQVDHFGGFIPVFERYSVSAFLASALDSSSEDFRALKKEVGSQGIQVLNPSGAKSIRLGKMYFDVVSESDREQAGVLGAYTSSEDPNIFSIVTLLSFGDFDALFTGDIGPADIQGLIERGELREIELLKVPHHGSKNGLSEALLQATSPEISLISAGKNNSYGHPHKETLDLLSLFKVDTYQTNKTGEIKVTSDGKTWQIEP